MRRAARGTPHNIRTIKRYLEQLRSARREIPEAAPSREVQRQEAWMPEWWSPTQRGGPFAAIDERLRAASQRMNQTRATPEWRGARDECNAALAERQALLKGARLRGAGPQPVHAMATVGRAGAQRTMELRYEADGFRWYDRNTGATMSIPHPTVEKAYQAARTRWPDFNLFKERTPVAEQVEAWIARQSPNDAVFYRQKIGDDPEGWFARLAPEDQAAVRGEPPSTPRSVAEIKEEMK